MKTRIPESQCLGVFMTEENINLFKDMEVCVIDRKLLRPEKGKAMLFC